ncbi:flagellar biosynthesis anti-sigma factor FlgM [bacterium]|jgi:negative regulator of flagellin synthesis FlgM|nr:flagellar biosynthesis anti-sigma factor FlgM [bacterium]
MKVTQTGSNPVQDTEISAAKKAERAAKAQEGRQTKGAEAASTSGARPEISAKGREFAKMREAAKAAPEVRDAKVQDLKNRVASGKYKVDAEAVADKMVNDHVDMFGIG